MIKFLLLTLIVCTLSACSPVPPPPVLQPTSEPASQPAAQPTPQPTPQPTSQPTAQPTPLVTEVDPEEYVLFSAMIDQGLVGFKQGGPVLIREQTDPDISNLEFALEGPADIPEELVEAYRLRNDQPYSLERSFTLKQDYTLMPQSEYDDLLRSGKATWADFAAKYPEVEGVFVVSRAGLNAARDEALVSISYYCGDLCAEGGVFLMVKEDGIWKFQQSLAAWMA